MSRYIGVDFYGTLEISRDAGVAEVNKAYRRLALKHHPGLAAAGGARAAAEAKFRGICEAYAVLSDRRLRSVYDAYGHDGLADESVGWKFDGDGEAVFKRFFGTENPFVYVEEGAHGFFSEKRRSAVEPKVAPVRVVTAEVRVGELFEGGRKEVAFERLRLAESGASVGEAAVVVVTLKRGMQAGDAISVPGMGDYFEGHEAGDLTVRLVAADEGAMSADGCGDVHLRYKVSLKDALCGAAFEVTTLDGRRVSCRVAEIVHPKYVRTVEDDGAWRRDGKTRGDLHVHFEVEFPRSLSAAQKKAIAAALDGGAEG